MSTTTVVNSPVVLFVSYLSIFSISNAIQISTPQGDIIGTTRTTLDGREIYAFLGIPFGKPPVGELRFKNPVPYGSWTGVKSAVEDGPMCLQIDMMASTSSDSNSSDHDDSEFKKLKFPDPKDLQPKLAGSEDCLYLNVFTPSVAEPGKYPVIFNIHGGGFIGGSGSSAFYGPEFLLDKDIVMVSINYRVGALGFASTEDAEMSGNWGLKDQTLALKWVQENIAAYGGNPDSVTILGGSAGGSSVHFQVISPLSKGLFHRAIAMSGAAHCPWAIKLPGENAKRTRKLASFLGCPTESSRLIVECFRKISPERFFHATRHFLVWDNDPMIVFTPVVESKTIDGAFLTENPLNAKSYVPMITGITKDEGAMKLLGFKMTSSIDERLSDLNENFVKYGPFILGYDSEDEDTTEMIKEIRKFYFGDKEISREVIQNFIDLFTDAWFLQCATSAVRNHQGDSYLYLFTYKGTLSISGLAGNDGEDFGVSHGEDHLYLFPMQMMLHERNITGDNRKMLDLLVNMWTNFAIHGNPTPEGSEITWNKVSTSEMNYLNINVKDLRMNKNLLADRDNFWQELHKKRFSTSRIVKGEL